MKQTVKHQKFSIFDEIFTEDNLKYIRLYLQHSPFEYPYSSDGFHGVSKEYKHSIIYNNVVDGVFVYAKKLAELDFCSGWKECTLTYSLYPCGSKSTWRSYKNYKAVMYFFVGENWKANWGGELLIGQTPPDPPPEDKALLNMSWHNDHLMEFGTGMYIPPKINRCVVVSGNEWLKINQVSNDAGENSLLFFQVLFS